MTEPVPQDMYPLARMGRTDDTIANIRASQRPIAENAARYVLCNWAEQLSDGQADELVAIALTAPKQTVLDTIAALNANRAAQRMFGDNEQTEA